MMLRRLTAMLGGALVLAPFAMPGPLFAASLGWRDDRADVALIGIRAEILRPIEVRVEASAVSGAPAFAPGGAPPAQVIIRSNPYVVTVTVDSAVLMRPEAVPEIENIRPLVMIRRKGPAPITPSLVPQGGSDTVVFTVAELSPGLADGINTVFAHFQ